MRHSFALLHLAALALSILTIAPAARGDAAQLRQALEALAGAVESPTTCGTDKKCQAVLRKSLAAFSSALASLDADQVSAALSSASKGASALEKGGPLAGDAPSNLPALLDALVAAGDDAVAEGEAEIDDSIAGLCRSARCQLQVKRARPGAASPAPARWSGALRAQVAALRDQASLVKAVDKAGAQCNPGACASSSFVHFTPGSGAALELLPPDIGTSACFEASADLDVDGTLCIHHSGRGRSEVSGTLNVEDVEVDVSGKVGVDSCLDSANWVRIRKLRLAFRLAAEELGRESVSVSVAPTRPAVSFFGALLPTPPSALRLQVGDRMEEWNVELRVRGGVELCDLVVHRVVAIENVSVAAGVFRAARIETAASCRIIMGGDEVDTEVAATTWVASEVGQVLVEADTDGVSTRYELSSIAIPEGC